MANAPVERIKSWLTPGLVTCFGMVLWTLFSEIRSDIKVLLAANVEVQVKIQSLERRINSLESVVYSQRVFAIKPDEVEIPKRPSIN